VPVYTADTDYTETIGGVVVTHLTTAAVRQFLEVTLSLLPKYMHAVDSEGVTHPKDLAQFSCTEFEMVIRSMKSKTTLPGLAQIRLKDACDFFQFILATNRTMKDQYLTYALIKSRDV